MKQVIDFLKTTLIGGLLIVLPTWISVLLLVKALSMMAVFTRPVVATLPEQAHHPRIAALLLLLLGCFLLGLLLRTALGRYVRRIVERHLLERLPGYGMIRGLTTDLAAPTHAHQLPVALVELEDGLVPALVVEHHADGRVTVFVPSSPTPFAGTIYILPSQRVHEVDVPLAKMMKCVTKWGAGSGELLAAARLTDQRNDAARAVPHATEPGA
ncbi:MAG: DUF502 domain-containing protein [Tepidisphaeraceae bacterium]